MARTRTRTKSAGKTESATGETTDKREEKKVLLPHRFAGTDHSVPCSECKQERTAHIHFR